MPNNRKATRGRIIQMINVPLTIKRTVKREDGEEREVTIPNPSKHAGGVKKINHKKIDQLRKQPILAEENI